MLNGLKSFFLYFIFSNIFISFCALAMTYEPVILFSKNYSNYNFFFFIFFSTLATYSFHGFFNIQDESMRSKWVGANKVILCINFIIGIIGCLYFFGFIKQYFWLILPVFLITFFYIVPNLYAFFFTFLSKFRIGKTLLLSISWHYVTCLIPILLINIPIHSQIIYYIVYKFIFIFCICLLFDYKDRSEDLKKKFFPLLLTYPKNI